MQKTNKSTIQILIDRCMDIQMYKRMDRRTDRQIGLLLQDPFIAVTPLPLYKVQGIEFFKILPKRGGCQNLPIKREVGK